MKLNRVYRSIEELPNVLPLFPLGGGLLLPRRPMQLNLFETRYLAMLDDSLRGERLIGMIQPVGGDESKETSPALLPIGCVGRIVQYAEIGDGRCFVTLMGVTRFHLGEEVDAMTPYRQAKADYGAFAADLTEGEGEQLVDRDALVEALRVYALSNGVEIDWADVKGASTESLVNGLSMMSPYGWREKQALLEAKDLKARAEMLVAIAQIEQARAGEQGGALH